MKLECNECGATERLHKCPECYTVFCAECLEGEGWFCPECGEDLDEGDCDCEVDDVSDGAEGKE